MSGTRKFGFVTLALVGALVAGCDGGEETEPIKCVTLVISSATVIGGDSMMTASDAAGCIGRVRVDSVGSDTTPDGTARVLYVVTEVEADSVASDTTP
jgi:hypothetical protein